MKPHRRIRLRPRSRARAVQVKPGATPLWAPNPSAKPLSHRNDGGVHSAQRKIGVHLHKLAHSLQIIVGDLGQNGTSRETPLLPCPLAPLYELANLRYDRRRNEKRRAAWRRIRGTDHGC